MQTFLPLNSFQQSADVLDYRRLGKQRVECKQILRALDNRAIGKKAGWVNHPAVVMWEGYSLALCSYALACCDRWIAMGYKDTIRPFFSDRLLENENIFLELPPWMGNERLHSSHRFALLVKDFDHYSRFNWSETTLPFTGYSYFWPKKADV